MSKLRFLLAGCGRIGARHLIQIKRIGTLTGVCDIIPDKTHAFAGEGVAVFNSFQAMMNAAPAADVMVICTPNGLHAEQSIQALQKGYHVLVEKPVALTESEVIQMIAAASEANRLLMPVLQNRFNPPVVAVKAALDAGAFGKIYSVQLSCLWNRNDQYYADNWHGTKDLDGGSLFTQFSHFIDILYWFFGEAEVLHAAAGYERKLSALQYEDCGFATLRFHSGALAGIHFSVDAYGSNREGALTILGEKGYAKIAGEYLNRMGDYEFSNYSLEMISGSGIANAYEGYNGSMSNHPAVYDNLLAVLQRGERPYATTAEAAGSIRMIEQIYAAAEQNRM
jgi:UDP-N-acetyl-2-amino-2-deoxyglucuronate dehydrogenase